MEQVKVRSVMTNEVLTVGADAGPAEIVKLITTHDVSALAVAGEFDTVIGVVTRSDILDAMTWQEAQPRGPLARWRRPRPEVGWRHTNARQMMTAPAVTIGPDATLAEAAGRMHEAGVKRLLVVDHRQHLVGIVSATDVLRTLAGGVPVFARAGEAARYARAA